MYKKNISTAMLCAFAAIAGFTAFAHMSCIYLGPSCYQAQMAPTELIESAKNGTLLAPIATVFVSALFVICGLFALSAAGLIKRLPLLTTASYSISAVCLVRGLATIPLSFIFPQMVSGFSVVAGITWFIAGLLFLIGFCWQTHQVK
ncbi:hypothetical protein ACMZOO_09170 [Catenovulum sp. SX2]|uniref:hypothetical protein n=1 Tax=Catenovulum sp. SX2 TaxID=3398614 RepID=UPI003F8775C5